MKIKEITPEAWRKLFDKSDSSNFFQSPDWLEVQAKVFKLKNRFFEIVSENTSYFISFQESGDKLYSNFIAYGGFIFPINQTLNLKLYSQTIKLVEKKTKKIIVRMKLSPFSNYINENKNFQTLTTALLQLRKNYLEQNRYINKKTRNLIRFAQKNEVVIQPIKEEDIDKFYEFYKKTMTRVKSSYLTPIEIFKSFSHHPSVFFLGAYKNNDLIAGSVFLKSNKVIYYWSNCSTDIGRKLKANYLLIHTAINIGIHDNCLYIDMGSSHKPEIEKPKLKWGAEKVIFYSYEK